ncbi:MAG: hypothetical protein JO015_10175 [Verrucomicrobia bacterium]|nr:hypothetical protein [Verrucomicrobiota bacterium]
MAIVLPAVALGEVILNFPLRKADGTQVVYQFQVPGTLPAEPFEQSTAAQHAAGVAALSWAKNFYNAHDIFMTSVNFKADPIPHYLATFNGDVGGVRQEFYAVVLGGNSVLEPVRVVAGP